LGGERGRLIPFYERTLAVTLIQEANEMGARLFKACDVLGISTRTFFRWKAGKITDGRKGAVKYIPRALSPDECDAIVAMASSKRFADETPASIVATLLEEDMYLASESTFYRCLREAGKLHNRSDTRVGHSHARPPERVATGPNQVWCWDITWLKSPVTGRWYFAYAVLDVWSRKIVGWEVHEKESADIAAAMFERLKREYNITEIYLHSDNGNAMTATTMLGKLHQLGLILSTSRPHVSDDNPFIESFFKTVKYTAGYPAYFKDIDHARVWFAEFVNWYNCEHRHSAIGYVTPNQRHMGEDLAVFAKRKATLEKAYASNPGRWNRPPVIYEQIKVVRLNAAPPDHNNEIFQRTS